MSLKFKTLEYASFERGSDWYWILGIAAIAIGTASIILGNTLFGFIIMIGSFGISLYSARKPKEIQIEIDTKGVKIGKLMFPYSSIQSFCISEDAHHERLRIRSNKKIMPMISVILSNINPESVKEELSQYIPEEQIETSSLQKIMEALGL